MFFQESSQGIVLHIKVIPNASNSQIVGIENDRLKIKVASPPEKNKANLKLIRYLSEILGIPKSNFSILRGETSPLKSVSIIGITRSSLLPNAP